MQHNIVGIEVTGHPVRMTTTTGFFESLDSRRLSLSNRITNTTSGIAGMMKLRSYMDYSAGYKTLLRLNLCSVRVRDYWGLSGRHQLTHHGQVERGEAQMLTYSGL